MAYPFDIPTPPWADDPAYLAYCEEADREEAEFERTGRLVCRACGQRAVKVTSTPTRQYGGGFDTFEHCENCGHGEVFV